MKIETSIVIRTLNEERHLGKLLESIQQQTYKAWEIILVDSGSTDATLEIARRHTSNIYHIPQKEFTFGRSLNWGCKPAAGRYLVFASAHVDPLTNTWLSNMVRPFEDPATGMVYGRQRGMATSSVAEKRDLQRVFGPTSKILIDEAFGNNGNSAIRKDLWVDQPFDEALTGLEDIDWARKIQQKGYRVYYAADAGVYHIHEESLRQVYRRMFREGLAYRRIFPGFRFGKVDFVKGLTYNILGDLLYATRNTTPLKKVPQVPTTRMAGHLGLWRGLHYHKTLSKEVVVNLPYPQVTPSVVINETGQHKINDTQITKLGSGEVLVQVAYAGVCYSDAEPTARYCKDTENGKSDYPIVPGREYSGIVVATGNGVKRIHPGDKVVSQLSRGGSYTHYLKVPKTNLYKLPPGVLLKQGSLVDSISACLNGIRRLGVSDQATTCVIGAGPLGNICAQILRRKGSDVMAVDQDERLLRLLHKYDVNTWQDLESTDRFNCLIDTTGRLQEVSQLIERAKPSAKILLIGPNSKEMMQHFVGVLPNDVRNLYASEFGESQDWVEAIHLIQNYAINLEDHTMNVLPLEDYKTAWKLTREREIFKALLLCSPALEWF